MPLNAAGHAVFNLIIVFDMFEHVLVNNLIIINNDIFNLVIVFNMFKHVLFTAL